jgi:prevent-host-death family protein
MKTATITEVKNGLSALIDRVRAGETIVVTDRGIPVARIEPAVPDSNASGRVLRLERAGVIRSGHLPPPVDLLRTPPPTLREGASGVAALLDDRRFGR